METKDNIVRSISKAELNRLKKGGKVLEFKSTYEQDKQLGFDLTEPIVVHPIRFTIRH